MYCSHSTQRDHIGSGGEHEYSPSSVVRGVITLLRAMVSIDAKITTDKP